jgi:hypothetical protein
VVSKQGNKRLVSRVMALGRGLLERDIFGSKQHSFYWKVADELHDHHRIDKPADDVLIVGKTTHHREYQQWRGANE